jgi:hypothetical protein
MPAHAMATAMNFPAYAGLIFLIDELTNDRYLIDTGATLSIIPCASTTSPSGPLLKRANDEDDEKNDEKEDDEDDDKDDDGDDEQAAA